MVTLTLLTLLACGDPAEPDSSDATSEGVTDDTGDAAGADDTGPDDTLTFDERTPSLDAAGVAAALEEAVEMLRWFDPALPLDAFEYTLGYSDGTCPAMESYATYDRYADYCVASNGAEFLIEADHLRDRDYTDEAGNYFYDYAYLQSDAYIVDPSGLVSEVGLYASLIDAVDTGGIRQFGAVTYGVYWWEDPLADGTWLTDPVTVSLQSEWYTLPDGATGAATVQFGGATGLPGQWVESFGFSPDFLIASEALGSQCEIEPAGTFSVRDRDGDWYDVTFTGPQFGEPPGDAADCDGCGDITWRGESLGQACPDLSGFIHWEDRPWD